MRGCFAPTRGHALAVDSGRLCSVIARTPNVAAIPLRLRCLFPRAYASLALHPYPSPHATTPSSSRARDSRSDSCAQTPPAWSFPHAVQLAHQHECPCSRTASGGKKSPGSISDGSSYRPTPAGEEVLPKNFLCRHPTATTVASAGTKYIKNHCRGPIVALQIAIVRMLSTRSTSNSILMSNILRHHERWFSLAVEAWICVERFWPSAPESQTP